MTAGPLSPVGQLPAPVCIRCGARPAMTDLKPGAKICAVCFLKALDLLFYELDRHEADPPPPPDPGR